MTYVFYADVFWMNQFLLHTAILLLAGQMRGNKWELQHCCQLLHSRLCAKLRGTTQKTDSTVPRSASKVPRYRNHLRLRYISASAIGSTCGTAVLLLAHSYYIYLAMALTVILPLMTLLAFGKSDAAVFRKRYAGCFASAILLGGLVTAMENIAGIAQIPFLSALIAFLLAERWIRLLMQRRQVQCLLYPVILRHGDGDVQINGLLDTGNLLRDPCSGRPVHLVRMSILESCGITETDFLGLVPYQALGSNDGLLAIYRAGELIIYSNTRPAATCPDICQADASESTRQAKAARRIHPRIGKASISTDLIDIRPAVIAAAPDELFYGKDYDAILNSAIITEGGSI